MTDYRFSRADFGPLPFAPLHYDLLFDIRPERVRVVSRQTYRYTEDEPTLYIELNAHDLNTKSVEIFQTKTTLGPPPIGIDAVVPDFVAHVASMADPIVAVFTYDKEGRKLKVNLPNPIHKGEELAIRVISTCVPTASELEGIYFDSTPDGAPQTMITQCQQYGFQRIVPCVDRMASKTFYTSTFVASTRYSNVVSNGDLAPDFCNEDMSPKFGTVDTSLSPFEQNFLTEEGSFASTDTDDRNVLRYYNHKVNMAPYLFFMGVGSYDVYKRQVEYPDGSTFVLELLCIPGVVEPKHADASLSALHDSILWLYLEGGPEKYDHIEERQQIYSLIERREELKRLESSTGTLVKQEPWSNKDQGSTATSTSATSSEAKDDAAVVEAHMQELTIIRNELKRLMLEWKETGYKYTGSVYREIAMENSNYGGMENVGNTTIISSRLTPSSWLVDGGYLYMEGVKIHEYYHNINGSQVTGQSPFEIWLNEAVTVHVQREREDCLFGASYMRLRKIIYAFQPATGPLAQDRSPTSMAVEPIGFNTTHELISAMTYSKAPEFVRMVQSILGKVKFVRALENYHQKFAYSNATTNDWIACMAEQAPGTVDLAAMADGWLRRTGYPTVTVNVLEYNAEKAEVTFKLCQSGFENQKKESNRYPWIIPVSWSLVKGGQIVKEDLTVLTETDTTVVISGISEAPDFISVGRDWSFFGNVKYTDASRTESQRLNQSMADPDPVNRYLAYASIVDAEKAKLIEAMVAGVKVPAVSNAYLQLFARILTDESLSPATRALFLNVHESIPSRDDLGHHYVFIAEARKIILAAVHEAHGDVILTMYQQLLQSGQEKQNAPQIDGLMERPLFYVLFSILKAGQEERLATDLQLLLKSSAMSDRFFALRALLELESIPATEKEAVHNAVKKEWVAHPIGCEMYIQCIANIDCPDTTKYIRGLVNESFFNINLAGHARTVARGWSANRKQCLMTDDGLSLTEELFLNIGKVNQMSAYSFLSAFGDLRKFDEAVQNKLVSSLKNMKNKLDPEKQQSLSNQLTILLKK